MVTFKTSDVVKATGGTLVCGGECDILSVCTDSRKIEKDCLFVPWVGEKFDGHDFISSALADGAAGCICAKVPEEKVEGKFYIQVEDTRLALKALASWYRSKFSIPFVQVTGSVGKTTTKEMIATVLSTRFNVLKTAANFNNDIGTPMTMFRLMPEHEVAVIETGMNHAGEIRYLGESVRPNVAVISNVGDAHIEFFGTREGILKAKCEIFENLKSDGIAVMCGDDALLNTVELPQRIFRCGSGENCTVRVTDIVDRGMDGISCRVTTDSNTTYDLEIPAPGVHMIYSSSIATLIGEKLGLTREEIIRGVSEFTPTGDRMKVEKLADGRVLLNDYYNANPQSMAAALQILSNMECTKKIAVLGDMGELGAAAEKAHTELGVRAAESKVDVLFAIGEGSRLTAKAAEEAGGTEVHWYAKQEEAFADIAAAFVPGAAMLVKASRFCHLEHTANYLREFKF